jgi:DNA-binding NtrC family response regulator
MPHTILVVDDDAAALSGLVELLNGAGYRTVGAGSFQEATHVLSTIQPDLLIADVRLVAFNGLQLVLRSRVTHPKMASIVISGFPDTFLENEAKLAGAAAYLVKPLNPSALLDKIEETLGTVVT